MKFLRFIALIVSLAFPCVLIAQSTNASLTGVVDDPSKAVISGVSITAINTQTGVQTHTATNGSGQYVVSELIPGTYRIEVDKEGFKGIIEAGLILHVQDIVQINFHMAVGSMSETVTVQAADTGINTTDGSVSTVIDRQFVENMPLNGRSFQSLIELSPGVVAVPNSYLNTEGEFSVNGERTETNAYFVDGVSANTGMNDLAFVGGTPGETALGTTQSLVSVDALQEFRISTSTYSAEFGRNPGAQISLQTRSGTNAWHGSTFDYFRNDDLDANNWFNDAIGLPKTAERQNDFGGTLGGPIRIPHFYDGRDKSFFFFSYEGLRLTVPQPALSVDVPDNSTRQSAPVAIQPILDAFPVQNGPEVGNGLALFTGSYSSPNNLDNYSIRLDHSFGDKVKIFGRYADTPSNSMGRALYGTYGDFANVTNTTSDIRTATIGVTDQISTRMVDELRFNYTYNVNGFDAYFDNFGGATPITIPEVTPGISTPKYFYFGAFIDYGTIPAVALQHNSIPQHQWNVTDSVSDSFGSHTLKFGIDFRQQVGANGFSQLQDEFGYYSPTDILNNSASFGLVSSNGAEPAVGTFVNFSAFAEDEWKATNRLHLSLGLRWDLNPPPTTNPYTYTLDQITDLATAQLAPKGTPLWHTDYLGFAPRFGLAYQIHQRPGHETVVRTGIGVFYDIGTALSLAGTAGGVGVGSVETYSSVAFPYTPAEQTLPAPSIASPYNAYVNASDPHLRLPYSLEWNAAIEQAFGPSQTVTMSYVASTGSRLLHEENIAITGVNPNFSLGNGLTIMSGGASSNYNSLQAQFQRRLSRGLQAMVSYTWSHAIDNLSNNAFQDSPLLRGNADFDVRQNFSAALTYDVQGNYTNPFSGAVLKHWGIDLRQTARSGFPVDIYNGFATLASNETINTRPDLVPGVPLYVKSLQTCAATAGLSNSAVLPIPGHRMVNLCAFGTPAGINGDEPRNFVRGFDAWQTDLAIRREFPIVEQLKLQFRAESFNLFNHPNFGSIQNYTYAGPTAFGKAYATLNTSLGTLNSLYQMGGPRSLQLALKLIF